MSKLNNKYRMRVSVNGIQKAAFTILSGVGYAYDAFHGARRLREGFVEEDRRHRNRKAEMVTRLFK